MKMKSKLFRINTRSGKMKVIVLRPENQTEPLPGILWIHGGGYALGMAEMVYFSVGRRIAKTFGGVVVSPEYRKSKEAPYPAAFDDCCDALTFMYKKCG